jgi:hypothetical protein
MEANLILALVLRLSQDIARLTGPIPESPLGGQTVT